MIKLRLPSFKRDFIYEVGFVFIATLLGFTFGYLYLVFMGRVLGLLQGLQRFKHFALSGYLLSQGLKLFFAVAFVWVGWDLLGAIGALLASTIIAIAAGLIPIRKQLVKAVQTKAHHDPGCKHYSFQVYSLLSLREPRAIDIALRRIDNENFSYWRSRIYRKPSCRPFAE